MSQMPSVELKPPLTQNIPSRTHAVIPGGWHKRCDVCKALCAVN